MAFCSNLALTERIEISVLRLHLFVRWIRAFRSYIEQNGGHNLHNDGSLMLGYTNVTGGFTRSYYASRFLQSSSSPNIAP